MVTKKMKTEAFMYDKALENVLLYHSRKALQLILLGISSEGVTLSGTEWKSQTLRVIITSAEFLGLLIYFRRFVCQHLTKIHSPGPSSIFQSCSATASSKWHPLFKTCDLIMDSKYTFGIVFKVTPETLFLGGWFDRTFQLSKPMDLGKPSRWSNKNKSSSTKAQKSLQVSIFLSWLGAITSKVNLVNSIFAPLSMTYSLQ